jgi:hypothetical protein
LEGKINSCLRTEVTNHFERQEKWKSNCEGDFEAQMLAKTLHRIDINHHWHVIITSLAEGGRDLSYRCVTPGSAHAFKTIKSPDSKYLFRIFAVNHHQ